MNPRERLLAGGIGAIVAAIIGWYGLSTVLGWFDTKDRQIDDLRKAVSKKKEELRKGRLALKRLQDYEERSLPPDVYIASSKYQEWLIKTTQQSGLDAQVTPQPRAVPLKNAYQRLTFTVKAKGELAGLIDFLHRFESMDWLHRIDVMNVTPLNDSKQLDLTFTITTASVKSAPSSDKLVERKSEQWQDRKLADYREPILYRNFFGAPNSQPKIDLAAKQTAQLGKAFELTIKASDPDPLDRVSYSLAKNADPPARLDERSGKLVWSPKSKGDFSFEVLVKDDGLPSKMASKTFTVSVVDPPPPPKPPTPPPMRLAFDDAKYTVLTGVITIESDNEIQPEAWLHIRPKNEIKKLRVGDRFEIGSVKGEVSEIGVDSVNLLIDGKLRTLGQGEVLHHAADSTD